MTNPPGDNLPEIFPAVIAYCQNNGMGQLISAQVLEGGTTSTTQRLITTSGKTAIYKSRPEVLPMLYQYEAEGLQVLKSAGSLRVPDVLLLNEAFIVLEDLGVNTPGENYWQNFGRVLALQHKHTSPMFGFDHDNYLGILPQHNQWTQNGHEFFIQHRVLRYLNTPMAEQAMTAEDRNAVERLAQRLHDLIPVQPASLLHGDLFVDNMLVGPLGEPAVIDPAVHYGWAEAELSMLRQYGKDIPQSFYEAYNEINPLAEGWWDRLELLNLCEFLVVIAQFGGRYNTVSKLRALLAKFL